MKQESETEETTRKGSMIVASVYCGAMLSLVAIGMLMNYFNKGRGR